MINLPRAPRNLPRRLPSRIHHAAHPGHYQRRRESRNRDPPAILLIRVLGAPTHK